ncbi:MAG: hypothetical protein ACREMT_11785, partial [Vulcanimicrobiaceae bacterium]
MLIRLGAHDGCQIGLDLFESVEAFEKQLHPLCGQEDDAIAAVGWIDAPLCVAQRFQLVSQLPHRL